MEKTLSNLVLTTQGLVLILDELGQEKVAQQFVRQLLREQGQECEQTIKVLPLSSALKQASTFDRFVANCTETNTVASTIDAGGAIQKQQQRKYNVLLPTLADLLCYQPPAIIFQFLYRLRCNTNVLRTFLWISRPHLLHAYTSYVIAACEYMSDLVLRLETGKELSIVTRSPGGGVTNERYIWVSKSRRRFLVAAAAQRTQPSSKDNSANTSAPAAPSASDTFKIELEEEELVARNALKLPYERSEAAIGGNIIYTPDANDDFDEEDPDEDLLM